MKPAGPIMQPLTFDLNPKDIKMHEPGGTSPNGLRLCQCQGIPRGIRKEERVLYS